MPSNVLSAPRAGPATATQIIPHIPQTTERRSGLLARQRDIDFSPTKCCIVGFRSAPHDLHQGACLSTISINPQSAFMVNEPKPQARPAVVYLLWGSGRGGAHEQLLCDPGSP